MNMTPLSLQLDYRAVLENMKLPEPGPTTLWWMFIAALVTAGVFIVIEFVSRVIRRNRRIRTSHDDFNQLALVCQLTVEERKLLRDLVTVCGIRYPDRLFTSFESFNRCLEEWKIAEVGRFDESDVRNLRIIRNKIFFGERSRIQPIASTRELRSNQWLHLKRKANGRVFMAPVVEAGPSGILVATPRIHGKYMEANPGEQFEFYFWRERDAGYHFDSEVIGQSGARYLVTIFRHAEKVQRIQRRRHHRVDVSIPVLTIPVTREELQQVGRNERVAAKDQQGFHAFVINISASGFALASHIELEPDDLVYLELPAGDEEPPIPVIGKILGASRKQTTDEILTHAEFVGLGAETQERIFWFIYSRTKHDIVSAT